MPVLFGFFFGRYILCFSFISHLWISIQKEGSAEATLDPRRCLFASMLLKLFLLQKCNKFPHNGVQEIYQKCKGRWGMFFLLLLPCHLKPMGNYTWHENSSWTDACKEWQTYTWTLYVFTRPTKAKYLQWCYRQHPFILALPRGNCIVPVFSLFPLCFNPCRCISRPLYECILWLYGCKSMLRVKSDCKRTQFWRWLRLGMFCLSVEDAARLQGFPLQ